MVEGHEENGFSFGLVWQAYRNAKAHEKEVCKCDQFGMDGIVIERRPTGNGVAWDALAVEVAF